MLKLEKYVEEISDNVDIVCNKTFKSILIKNSHILANIFLNNYSKLINDQISTQNKDSSKRKLLKFCTAVLYIRIPGTILLSTRAYLVPGIRDEGHSFLAPRQRYI
jgi:hypothetical protein